MPDRVRLTVPSEGRSLALVDALVERYATSVEVPPAETAELVGLVGDAVRFVLEHAYPGDPTGEVEVTLDVSDGSIGVDVHDWGRPLAAAGGDAGALPPQLQAIAERADGVRLVNLGADGKRLRLAKRVSHVLDTGPEAHDFGAPTAARQHDTGVREHVEVRCAAAADAEAISQLLYENYHLSYGHPDFYRPRWVAAELDRGTLVSTIAVYEGDVVGHHALMPSSSSPAAETGVAVVHPAFRGLGILGLLFDRTLTHAKERGLAAVWGRAVTVHPYSQRAERSHGYRESALMLASVPAAMTMAGLADLAGKRTASLLAYRMLEPRDRAVFLPELYATQLRAAYEHLGLAASNPQSPAAPPDGETVSWRVEEERQTGWLTVTGWDDDHRSAAAHALRQLLSHHVDVLYADVDLTTVQEIDAAVETLNSVDFSYAGLVPSGGGGHDFVRLQRVNTDRVELDEIVCDSPFAQALLRDVLADRERVD